jgi:hypothetical protein
LGAAPGHDQRVQLAGEGRDDNGIESGGIGHNDVSRLPGFVLGGHQPRRISSNHVLIFLLSTHFESSPSDRQAVVQPGLHNSPERGQTLCKIAQIGIGPCAENGTGRRADEGPAANDRDALSASEPYRDPLQRLYARLCQP